MRKLKPILLALLLGPAAAYPLGLGDIRLHSGLNQPLSAEIDLLSVAADDVPSIVASLASSEAFQQVGLDRPMALMAIEFSVEQRPGGTYFIKATTGRPVHEPFLDFLLEVNWRSGRVLREYTLLLDPPELMKKEAPPAVRAPATAATTGAAATRGAGAVRGAAVVPGKAAASTGPRTYGPVKGNETLWSIANKLRPNGSVTVPQVMMALLKGNPDAFEDNNVNRLRAGTVLRLDPALLKAMSRADAAREIGRQDREWQDFKQRAAGQATTRAPSGEAAVPRSAAAVKAEEPRLKLVAPEAAEPGKADASGTAADGAQAIESLKKELLLAQEANAAGKQETEELRKRVQELEGQITAMQRLLSLKDDDLATLQRQVGKAGEAPVIAPAAQATASDVVVAAGSATPAEGAAPAPEQTPATAPEAAAVAPAQAPASGEAPAAETSAVAAAQAPQAEAAKAEEPKPVKKPRRPAPPPPPPPEPTLVDTLLANPLYSGLFLLLGVALVTLVALVIRRRRSGGNFTESILMGGTPSMMKAKAAEGKQGEESSFFSDFAVSGMGDIQAEDSEVDPLTEADVYMAYQRYQQAEDLVKDALKHNPERPELHVKLLEVYHATKDKTKFEAEALKTHALLDGTGPLWAKVLVLGHELLPDHALFAKAPEAPVAAGPDHADARLDNEVLDIGLDLDALTEEMESGGSNEFNLDLGVDFSDLEDLAPKKATAPADSTPVQAPAPAATEESGFDLDLDVLAPEPAPAAATAPTPSPAATNADIGLDFDLGDLALDEPAQPAETVAASPDFDLNALSLDAPADASEVSAPASTKEEEGGLDLDGFDLGSLDLGGTESDAEPAGEMSLADLDTEGVGELNLSDMELPEQDATEDLLLGDINEVDTKLDLARAYVGMGDSDGARNLLDEVMQEGDATQKQQAEELLQQIA